MSKRKLSEIKLPFFGESSIDRADIGLCNHTNPFKKLKRYVDVPIHIPFELWVDILTYLTHDIKTVFNVCYTSKEHYNNIIIAKRLFSKIKVTSYSHPSIVTSKNKKSQKIVNNKLYFNNYTFKSTDNHSSGLFILLQKVSDRIAHDELCITFDIRKCSDNKLMALLGSKFASNIVELIINDMYCGTINGQFLSFITLMNYTRLKSLTLNNPLGLSEELHFFVKENKNFRSLKITGARKNPMIEFMHPTGLLDKYPNIEEFIMIDNEIDFNEIFDLGDLVNKFNKLKLLDVTDVSMFNVKLNITSLISVGISYELDHKSDKFETLISSLSLSLSLKDLRLSLSDWVITSEELNSLIKLPNIEYLRLDNFCIMEDKIVKPSNSKLKTLTFTECTMNPNLVVEIIKLDGLTSIIFKDLSMGSNSIKVREDEIMINEQSKLEKFVFCVAESEMLHDYYQTMIFMIMLHCPNVKLLKLKLNAVQLKNKFQFYIPDTLDMLEYEIGFSGRIDELILEGLIIKDENMYNLLNNNGKLRKLTLTACSGFTEKSFKRGDHQGTSRLEGLIIEKHKYTDKLNNLSFLSKGYENMKFAKLNFK